MRPADACLIVARRELGDGLRNRWIWTVSALFGVSVLAIAYFGAAPVGVAGVQEGEALLASVMNLAVYLVPLVALVLGCGAVIEDKRRGMLDLVLVAPVSPFAYFGGVFLGFVTALAIALGVGFGVSALVLRVQAGVGLHPYVFLGAMALALGAVFLAVAFLLSILSRDRGRAIALSVFVWIAFVLVYDLILIGVLIASGGHVDPRVFGGLLLLNPIDVFRILCLKWLAAAAVPLGLSAAMPLAPSPAVLAAALAAWLVAPLAASYAIFRRRLAADTL